VPQSDRSSLALASVLVVALVAASGAGTGVGVGVAAAGPAPGPDPSLDSEASIDSAASLVDRAAATDGAGRPSGRSAPATERSPPSNASVLAVYPNPVADDDAGEYVVVRTARPANVSDGEGTARVPAGTHALSPDPAAARNLTDRPVRRAPLDLSNAGERLSVSRNGTTLAERSYADAPEGERLTPDGEWLPRGYAPRPVRSFGPACATAFVLPDSPEVVRRTLRGADRRLLLAGYTFTSDRVASVLVAAARRGVDVRVLVDDAPVGGLSTAEAEALDRLTRAGIPVRVVGGERAPFDFHHPKYAVVDDTALVLTENWKPGGVGGRDSRGWGVRVSDPALAADLAALHRADATGPGARNWSSARTDRTFEPVPGANGSYPSRLDPSTLPAREVRVLTAPGNAGDAVVRLVEGAERRVDVLGPTLGSADGPLAGALVRAARRGVAVRILLSSAWYAEAENARVAERLSARADRRDLPLSVRLADPAGRYGKLHAKGMIVDDTVVVGSLNWNAHAARENREVSLALRGEAVAAYYERAFESDWDGRRRVPVELVLVVVVAAGVAVAVARRRLSFEPTSASGFRDAFGPAGGSEPGRDPPSRGTYGEESWSEETYGEESWSEEAHWETSRSEEASREASRSEGTYGEESWSEEEGRR
jgi:phosphatidylserine/phosphatidylglycerophosphate/cardiolipin synthase-like enzyme